MNIFRLILGAPIAALMTLIVFGALAMILRPEVRLNLPMGTDDQPARTVVEGVRSEPEGEAEIAPQAPEIGAPPPLPARVPEDKGEAPRVDRCLDCNMHIPEVTPPSGELHEGGLVLPEYPKHCMADAALVETVVVGFDVNDRGYTENVRVIEATNGCFNDAALAWAWKLKYPLKIVDGQPVWRRDVRRQVTFELAD